jgi:hypothetical protein
MSYKDWKIGDIIYFKYGDRKEESYLVLLLSHAKIHGVFNVLFLIHSEPRCIGTVNTFRFVDEEIGIFTLISSF